MLTFKIPLDMSGAAGLGVSVKGKRHGTPDQDEGNTQDKGIYCKSIILGGAAAKDGRLRPDDQLLRVNGKSLVGLTNQLAMKTLRHAMQSTRPNQAFIDVTIAREQEDAVPPPGALLQSRSLENLNAPDQERPIEAGSEEKRVEEPQNASSEVDGVPRKTSRFYRLKTVSFKPVFVLSIRLAQFDEVHFWGKLLVCQIIPRMRV